MRGGFRGAAMARGWTGPGPFVAPTVSIAGTVTIGGTLTATETNATSRQWQRGATWDGGGSWSDIGAATATTYTPVSADIGYSIRCVSSGPGGTANSNTLIYDPTTVTAVIEVWKIRTLSAGALSSWVGAKAGYTLAALGTEPTVGATAFNGTVGITFDGVNDQLSGTVDLSSTQKCRIVFAVDDSTTNVDAVYEHGGDVTAGAGRLLFLTNVGGANTGHRFYTSGAGAALGVASFDQDLGTAQYISVCHDTTIALGVGFVRTSGTAESLGSVVASCAAANLANGTFYLGTRYDGSALWAGTLGGALMILSGSAQDGDLADAEAYTKNGGGL